MWTCSPPVNSAPSASFPGQDPLLACGPAVANHRHRAVEARSAHDAFPQQLSVLRAFRFGFEHDSLAGSRRRVRAVAVTVLIARGRAKAAALEDQRVGVARCLAALEDDAVEAPAVEAGTRTQRALGRIGHAQR